MRVNIYAEELTDRVEIVEKETADGKFTGLRFYLYLPVTASRERDESGLETLNNVSGPFIHREGDDDSAAVTFWGKRQLRDILAKALDVLDKHYETHSESITDDRGLEWDVRTIKLDGLLSETAMSNLFTMAATALVDPRQALPEHYTIPPEETRRLRARLILEEALETIEGLGFEVCMKDGNDSPVEMESINFLTRFVKPDLNKIIDGCVDLDYVSDGTLIACGVPDLPHKRVVNLANNAKFPKGVATVNEHGKYQKPEGWRAPDHTAVRESIPELPHFAVIGTNLLEESKKERNKPTPSETSKRVSKV